MRVRELRLCNYRAFGDEQAFVFRDRFTVIAGVNGRGKTAILDGLALLLSRLLVSLDLVDYYRLMYPSELHGAAENAQLSMKVSCGGIPLDYVAKFSRARPRLNTSVITTAVKEEIRRSYGDPTREDDQAPLAVYYTTDRAGYRLHRKLPSSLSEGQRVAGAGGLINRMVDYRDFMARFLMWKKDQGHARTIASLERVLSVFLDGFSNVEVQESPLRLTVRKGAHRLSLDQLSDGERSFIAMASDLVRRLSLANPALTDPLLGAGVVLIDEIELHLHPRWQRGTVEKLRSAFPNIQFIATTHSPFVIQSLRAGELVNLDPEEFGEYEGKSIDDIAENVMGVPLPQKSERYLKMMHAAEYYFRLLRQPDASPQAVDVAQSQLNELAIPYSDDPAFQALLKLERATSKGDTENETGS